MTRKVKSSSALPGALKTAPGDPAACRDGFLMMHPTPGAVPSQAMIEALSPDNIRVALQPHRWERVTEIFDCPEMDPSQAGSFVYALTQSLSDESRAELVREHTAEIWTLISIATAPYPESAAPVAAKFPGLQEAFDAATDTYGCAAMLRACGITTH